MKYTIDEKICNNLGLDLPSVLAVILVKSGVNISKLFNDLVQKQVLVSGNSLFNEYQVTQRWDDVVSTILLDSEQQNPSDNDAHLEKLARSLMEVFPEGRKPDTNVYWRGNVRDIKLRLKKFFKLYGTKYTDSQILDATRRYVDSFNGNYSYMRVLKYFLWKDAVRKGSEGNYIEDISDLATLIENEGQEDTDRDWTTNIV